MSQDLVNPIPQMDPQSRARLSPFLALMQSLAISASAELRALTEEEVDELRTLANQFHPGSVEREAVDYLMSTSVSAISTRPEYAFGRMIQH